MDEIEKSSKRLEESMARLSDVQWGSARVGAMEARREVEDDTFSREEMCGPNQEMDPCPMLVYISTLGSLLGRDGHGYPRLVLPRGLGTQLLR